MDPRSCFKSGCVCIFESDSVFSLVVSAIGGDNGETVGVSMPRVTSESAFSKRLTMANGLPDMVKRDKFRLYGVFNYSQDRESICTEVMLLVDRCSFSNSP